MKKIEPTTENNYLNIAKFGAVFLILLFFFSIAVSMLYGEGIILGFLFFTFQLCGILLPGFALLLVLKLEISTTVEWVAFSYFFGYCLNLIEYILIVPLKLHSIALPSMLFVTLISIMVIVKNYSNQSIHVVRDKKCEAVCSIFLFTMLSISVFTYAGANLLPPKANQNILLNDLLYWVGNTIELTREFPPKDFRSYPNNFNYHYFSSLQLAYESIITGIKPVVLSFAFSFIQSVTLMVMGAIVVFRKCTQNIGYIILGMFLLFFTSGDENLVGITYMGHMYLGGFGQDYGMGIFLFLLYFLVELYEKKEFDIKISIIVIMTLGINMGIKTPFACIALCGIGVLCIGWLLDKSYKKAFTVGIPILVVFILGFIYVVNVIGYGGSLDVLKQPTMLESNWDLQVIYNNLGMIGTIRIPRFMQEILFYIYYCILCNPAIFSLLIVSVLFGVVKEHKWKLIDSILMTMIITGAWITLYIGMVGFSNMYFMMVIYPVCICFALYRSEIIPIRWYTVITGSIVIIISFVGFMNGHGDDTLFSALCKGYGNYFHTADTDYDVLNRSYINESQYEAYMYIREHTTPDTLLTTNKEQMIVGVFTERYVIGTGGNNPIFLASSSNDLETVTELYRNQNIDYIVYDIATTPEFKISSDYVRECFKNESTIIYKFNE